MLQLLLGQWIHLGYGWSSTQNRRPSAPLNRRNVCIYQNQLVCMCVGVCVCIPVKAFGVVRSVNSECVHLSYDIQHTAIRTRTSTGTLYLRIPRERDAEVPLDQKTVIPIEGKFDLLERLCEIRGSARVSETLSSAVFTST